VIGFVQKPANNRNLSIFSAMNALNLPNGVSIRFVKNQGLCNENSSHSLISKFQSRKIEIKFESTCHRLREGKENGDQS
jgi:hypothetical protein